MRRGQNEIQFQKDGPYREYSERHVQLHKKNNALLLALSIPTVLYLSTRFELFLLLGILQLAISVAYGKREERRLMDAYTDMERNTLLQLEEALNEIGFAGERTYSFGYWRTESSFDPVFLLKYGETLHVYENVLIKNCIYGTSGQMLYLLDLDREKLKQELCSQSLSELHWSRSKLPHQRMLCEEGIRTNRYLVLENVIYAKILEDMKRGKRKHLLNMNYIMTEIRKEPVYEAECPVGGQLVVPVSTGRLLQLFEPKK